MIKEGIISLLITIKRKSALRKYFNDPHNCPSIRRDRQPSRHVTEPGVFLLCTFVPVCVLPGSTDCDGLRDRDTDGCVTHATPINPKTHRNLANAGAAGREGGRFEGDLSSQQTVSFDSEQKN